MQLIFLFYLDLILYAYNIPLWCDSFEILNFTTKQGQLPWLPPAGCCALNIRSANGCRAQQKWRAPRNIWTEAAAWGSHTLASVEEKEELGALSLLGAIELGRPAGDRTIPAAHSGFGRGKSGVRSPDRHQARKLPRNSLRPRAYAAPDPLQFPRPVRFRGVYIRCRPPPGRDGSKPETRACRRASIVFVYYTRKKRPPRRRPAEGVRWPRGAVDYGAVRLWHRGTRIQKFRSLQHACACQRRIALRSACAESNDLMLFSLDLHMPTCLREIWVEVETPAILFF